MTTNGASSGTNPGGDTYTPSTAMAQTQNTALANTPTAAETAATILATRAAKMIEARTLLALKRPRDLAVVRQRTLALCKDPLFAEDALYSKPMGSKSDDEDDSSNDRRSGGVEGLSIRFVEAVIQIMGNIEIETLTVLDDGETRRLRISVIDLETNVGYTPEVTLRKTIERRFLRPGDEALVIRQRQTSRGKPIYIRWATDEEILDKANALISKTVREAAKRLIPADIRLEAERTIRATLEKKDTEAPDTQKKKILDGFFSIGITADKVREFIGHDLSSLTPKEMQLLRGSFQALREGSATWDEIMEGKKEPVPETAPQPAAAAPPPAKPAPKPTFCGECGTRSDQPVPPHTVECSQHPDNRAAAPASNAPPASPPPANGLPAGAAAPGAAASAPPSGSPDPGAAAEVLARARNAQPSAAPTPTPTPAPTAVHAPEASSRGTQAVKDHLRARKEEPPASGERRAPPDAPARAVQPARVPPARPTASAPAARPPPGTPGDFD